MLIFLTQHN